MTYEHIADMVEAVGRTISAPTIYNLWPEGSAPDPPYLVFWYPESQNFYADNKVYAQFTTIRLELYTASKEPAMELAVEAELDRRSVAYQKREEYIEEEQLCMVIYEMAELLTV